MKIVVGLVVGAAAVLVVASWIAIRRWRSATAALVARLTAGRGQPVPAGSIRSELESLPEPVARYLRLVLGTTTGRISTAAISWRGEFLARPEASRWSPFDADQVYHTNPAGFVWDARIRMAPGLVTYVRDGFVGGHGLMRGAIGAAITVVDAKPSAELDAAALQRYLAEAVWFPTGLLPSSGVTWQARDERSAQARVTAGAATVELEFRFGPDSLVESVFAPGRFRDVDGRNVATPWEGRFARYEQRGGLLIPTEAEVAWLLPEGRLTYWRGVPTAVEYTWHDR